MRWFQQASRTLETILFGNPDERDGSHDCDKKRHELAKTRCSASVGLSSGISPCVEFKPIPYRFREIAKQNNGEC